MDDVSVFTETLRFPPEVHQAIAAAFPSDDAMDQPEFDPIALINSQFPTEQSLSGLDVFLEKLNLKIGSVDKEIQAAVREQSQLETAGKQALADAQRGMEDLFTRIRDIRAKADMSERMVQHITKDIKSLDYAKHNLTTSITTLNHLHMLVSGMDALHSMVASRQYREAANLLAAVSNVMEHLHPYLAIERVKRLADEITRIKRMLTRQINSEFAEAFRAGPTPDRAHANVQQLGEACLVMDVLDADEKQAFIDWFIQLQLRDYTDAFDQSKHEDQAWLDKVDKRYAWLKHCLATYRESCGDIFPVSWYIPEVIARAFCDITRADLLAIINRKHNAIDVKLLLFAVGKTASFEKLLDRLFVDGTQPTQAMEEAEEEATQEEAEEDNVDQSELSEADRIRLKYKRHAREEQRKQRDAQRLEAQRKRRKAQPKTPTRVPAQFKNSISQVFDSCMSVYIKAQKSALQDMIELFSKEFKKEAGALLASASKTDADGDASQAKMLATCTDLFVFFKSSIDQCKMLSVQQPLRELSEVIRDYLQLYADRVLLANLPKANLLQGKDSSISLSADELFVVCLIINTSEYCQETIAQVEQTLRNTIAKELADSIDLAKETDAFLDVTSKSILVLVRGLETACESSLVAMAKMHWNLIEDVGDSSPYVREMATQLRRIVPVIRSNLPQNSKYFVQMCMRFADSFIPKILTYQFKCRNVAGVGAEQMLLDMQSIRALLLDIPAVDAQTRSSANTSYVRFVTKTMSKAEMIPKVIMTPHDDAQLFVEDYNLKLAEEPIATFQKILDMKGLKKPEQTVLLDAFKGLSQSGAVSPDSQASDKQAAAPSSASMSATAAVNAAARATANVKSKIVSVTRKANVDRILRRFKDKKDVKEDPSAS